MHIAAFFITIILGYSLHSVQTAPTLKKRGQLFGNQKRAIDEGNTIELECKADGTSPPLIHWLFNGQYVKQSPLDLVAENLMTPASLNTRTITSSTFGPSYTTKSTLQISKATLGDSGTYTCVADTPSERVTQHYNILVNRKESLTVEVKKNGKEEIPTVIYQWTQEVYEHRGNPVVMVCRATRGVDKPIPVIQWSIGNVPIDATTPGVILRNNGDLEIQHVSDEFHMADFKCTATGDDGTKAEVEPFLYVYRD